MKTDNVALGRQGEIFVMRKLFDEGWSFPKEHTQTLDGLDWVFEKNGRKIKIQVKTSIKRKNFSVSQPYTFDYLIFNNLIDLWVIPVEMLKVSISEVYNKLKNKMILLEKSKTDLLLEINDCGVRFCELDTTTPFFKQNQIKSLKN